MQRNDEIIAGTKLLALLVGVTIEGILANVGAAGDAKINFGVSETPLAAKAFRV